VAGTPGPWNRDLRTLEPGLSDLGRRISGPWTSVTKADLHASAGS
jgi:hypothetical protein